MSKKKKKEDREIILRPRWEDCGGIFWRAINGDIDEAMYSDFRKQEVVVWDLETTGFIEDDEYGPNKIVQFCGIKYAEIYGNLKPVAELNFLIQPERPIPSGSSQHTKIYDETVADAPTMTTIMECGRPLWQVIVEFLQDCNYVAGHNILSFDIPFIRKQFKEYLGDDEVMLFRPPIDTMVWRSWVKDNNLSGIQLKETAAHYGCSLAGEAFYEMIQLHNAYNDVRLNAELLKSMSSRVITQNSLLRILEDQGRHFNAQQKKRDKRYPIYKED